MPTIELRQSVFEGLAALANAEGLSLESYLERVADPHSHSESRQPRLTGEELDRLLDAEASHDVTYQGTYPRADIYLDHD